MKKYLTPILFLLSLIPLSLQLNATPDESFNYNQSVALILYAEGGGHIFQRPERFEPQNAFTLSFGIINKYISQMQPVHSGLMLDMDSLQPHDTFSLINHNSSKTLYFGDHWLGDKTSFATMDPVDYQHLKTIFDARKRISDRPTPQTLLDTYRDEIHELWQEDSEEFYRRYYFPERNNTSINTSSNPNIAPADKPSLHNQDLINTGKIDKAVIRNEPDFIATAIDSRGNTGKIQSAPSVKKETCNRLLIISLLGFIFLLIACYWWWHKRK